MAVLRGVIGECMDMPTGAAGRGGVCGSGTRMDLADWLRNSFLVILCVGLFIFLGFRFRKRLGVCQGLIIDIDRTDDHKQTEWFETISLVAGELNWMMPDAGGLNPSKWFPDGSRIFSMQWSSSVLECWKWILLDSSLKCHFNQWGQLHQGQLAELALLVWSPSMFYSSLGMPKVPIFCSISLRSLHCWIALRILAGCLPAELWGKISWRRSHLPNAMFFGGCATANDFLKWVTERLVHCGPVWFCPNFCHNKTGRIGCNMHELYLNPVALFHFGLLGALLSRSTKLRTSHQFSDFQEVLPKWCPGAKYYESQPIG